jgi:RNA polymerase sigma factor (sigma-70 family)
VKAPETEADPWEVDLAFDLALERHEDLVRIAAARWDRKTPPAVSREELYAAGLVGLWFWAVRQDGREDGGRAYAAILVHGAIGDYIRECPWLTVSLRRRFVPDRVVFLIDDGVEIEDLDRNAAWVEEVDELRAALRGLPKERDREILVDRWLRSKTQLEIADERGLTESRISQIELQGRAVYARYQKRRDAC